MASGVVERPAEFRTVVEFLDSTARQPSGLVIDGEAGIGKTTLWLAGVEKARERGFRVFSARAAEAETALTYAAVADLLADVDQAVIAALPDVQRLAVDRVLLRATGAGPPTDEGVVAAAVAAIVDRLAEDAPVLVAVDDVQWLDASSQSVVTFAVRRFSGRVGLLFTERTAHEGPSAAQGLQLAIPDGVRTVHVGPLSLGGLHALVSERLGRSFPRPTMVRIADISGGNPFYALELARAIEAGAKESLLPATLAELMRQRIGRLRDETQDLLLAAACAAAPTVGLLAQVTGTTTERAVDLLGEAKAKGIIAIDGDSVRFTHPLLARSVYTDATPGARRAMHRALSETLEPLEVRARHMALAAASADPDTLQALDDAAAVASQRGAPSTAAELLDLAIGLGGDAPTRRIRAADHCLHAGDLERAYTLLDSIIDRIPPGIERAMALNLLAAMRIHHNSFTRAVSMLEEALDNTEGDREVRVRTLLLLSYARLNAGEFAEALQNVERAASYSEDVGDPDLTSQVLAVRATIACMCGRGVDLGSLRRALALEEPNSDAPIAFRASANNALMLAWVGRLDESSELLAEVRRRCIERGAETDLIFVAVFSALTEIWRGRYDEAARVAAETVERAQQLGGDHMRIIAMTVSAAVAAYAGDQAKTREKAAGAIDLAYRCQSPRLADWASVSLGFLEVSLGRYEQAVQALKPLTARFELLPGTEIITVGYAPDAIEALIALGRADEAEPMIEALESNGRLVDRPWMLATGARGRSLLLAARGDIGAACEMAEQALAHHKRLPMPFEHARTQLLLGQLQRRHRKKDAARKTLTKALQTFESLGAPLWADRARAELERFTITSGKTEGLTPAERRVAELAAKGMTTRDVATALFISPKTVEANLARIYRKLGIKTRAELGRAIVGTEEG
ncbi:helix-turn-helix transcriptional regulator [Mycolicibacterium sp. XJ1819]